MSLEILRWSLALVLGSGAVHLLLTVGLGGHSAPLVALAAAELVAALLFVMSATARAGGIALLAVLAVAATLHVPQGEPPPSSFAVYAVAIWALTAREVRS
jgi:hypothetical protein